MNDVVRRGARIYSKPVLGAYDLLVVRLSNSVAWRCPRHLMLELYNCYLGPRHLDVGPGTGWYLAHAHRVPASQITLMDLNPHSLDSASAHLGAVEHRTVVADVLDPLPESIGPMDSIAANFLIHCLPGSWSEKGTAFRHLADRLSDEGVLFGATILGRGVDHNLVGQGLMALYNTIGVFQNRDDDARGLEAALRLSFQDVTVRVVGTVALFTARRPWR
ncbi:MAG TPA: class I SAM-dependent methyltransferase [Candidatus Brachybacterium merdavium]|uniref:Class I SAM-dependent methyltransferase n=1 Tax=Candidatus Brachybacterium merdavium TaxID=2838513 RepID=A0A9D2LFN4_9MICO|nr:class I SAM-dependent methyltransferase [Candidatus Brachybacterium merdavium]